MDTLRDPRERTEIKSMSFWVMILITILFLLSIRLILKLVRRLNGGDSPNEERCDEHQWDGTDTDLFHLYKRLMNCFGKFFRAADGPAEEDKCPPDILKKIEKCDADRLECSFHRIIH